MPAMGGQFNGGFLADDQIRITRQLCEQGHAVDLDLEQRGIAEIILAGDLPPHWTGLKADGHIWC